MKNFRSRRRLLGPGGPGLGTPRSTNGGLPPKSSQYGLLRNYLKTPTLSSSPSMGEN